MVLFLGRWENSLMAMFNVFSDASGAPDDCDAWDTLLWQHH
jgi:hypothetical protein